jgi:Histidine kinase-, DNA gyrase B-, and HSP90-like ATPase
VAASTSKAAILSSFEESGTKEGEVEVDISYDIIRHVSAQLYTNPRKAIEELVCNSYDAGATVCYVTVPKDVKDSLKVLDNGKSMDFNGLKDLWKVAWSPKDEGPDNPRIENDRMQIGKFGVGKLAAFALGERLTHVACVNKNVRVVSVGQREIKQKKKGEAPTFKVFRMSLDDAIPFLEPHFGDLPKPWQEKWDRWTLALVEEIDERSVGRALLIGVLRRMISTALPISANFKVFLEGVPVPKREIDPADIETTVEITDPDLRKKIAEALQGFWMEVLGEEKAEDVPKKYYDLKVEEVPNPEDVKEMVPALIVPELGPIIGKAILTKNSLTPEKLIERGYSNNGFAIRVNGKVVNPEDELFGVTARSHAYWSRFLANVEIPGLDKVILVQRNAVSENSNEAQIARTIMRTLFNFTRSKQEEREKEEGYKPESFGSRIRTLSPISAAIAFSGLVEGEFPKGGLESLDVDFSSLGESGPAARYDREEKKILVNEDHPLVEALDDIGANTKALRHVIGEVLAGTEMAKGYLRSQNVPEKVVEDTGEIVEVSIRSAANFVIDEIEEHIKEIDEMSYSGDRPFEKAIVSALRSLRLVAIHEGRPGDPDGVVEIPVSGMPNVRISIEAKGSKGVISHADLARGTVIDHMTKFHCDNAFAVAREFQLRGAKGEDSALVQQTRDQVPRVPLITTAALFQMLRLHKKKPFSYDKVIKIFTTWTPPNDLEGFIQQTWKELPDLGLMELILRVAHEQVEKDQTNLPEPGMILADDRIRKWTIPTEDGKGRRNITRADLEHILEAMQITTQLVLITTRPQYQFKLLAPVETILEYLKEGQD